MQRMTALACAVVAGLAGCARDVRVRLPTPADQSTGSISVLLTHPARDLTVAVDGRLVASRAHTDTVRIDGVPVGMADVVIAAGGGEVRVERHVRVEVRHGEVTAIPIGSPEQSLAAAMNLGVLSVAAFVLSRALVWAFL